MRASPTSTAVKDEPWPWSSFSSSSSSSSSSSASLPLCLCLCLRRRRRCYYCYHPAGPATATGGPRRTTSGRCRRRQYLLGGPSQICVYIYIYIYIKERGSRPARDPGLCSTAGESPRRRSWNFRCLSIRLVSLVGWLIAAAVSGVGLTVEGMDRSSDPADGRGSLGGCSSMIYMVRLCGASDVCGLDYHGPVSLVGNKPS